MAHESGSYAYVTAYASKALTVVDVAADPPYVVGTVSDATKLNGANGVLLSRNRVYVSSIDPLPHTQRGPLCMGAVGDLRVV